MPTVQELIQSLANFGSFVNPNAGESPNPGFQLPEPSLPFYSTIGANAQLPSPIVPSPGLGPTVTNPVSKGHGGPFLTVPSLSSAPPSSSGVPGSGGGTSSEEGFNIGDFIMGAGSLISALPPGTLKNLGDLITGGSDDQGGKIPIDKIPIDKIPIDKIADITSFNANKFKDLGQFGRPGPNPSTATPRLPSGPQGALPAVNPASFNTAGFGAGGLGSISGVGGPAGGMYAFPTGYVPGAYAGTAAAPAASGAAAGGLGGMGALLGPALGIGGIMALRNLMGPPGYEYDLPSAGDFSNKQLALLSSYLPQSSADIRSNQGRPDLDTEVGRSNRTRRSIAEQNILSRGGPLAASLGNQKYLSEPVKKILADAGLGPNKTVDFREIHDNSFTDITTPGQPGFSRTHGWELPLRTAFGLTPAAANTPNYRGRVPREGGGGGK